MFRCCVLHHQDKQTQPGPGAPIHLSRTVALSQPVRKPSRTPGDACVMAEPWHSPCPRQHQELQRSRTWAWSACCCWRWAKGKRGWVQFMLSWSTFLAGISGKLHLLWLFLPWHGAAALGCVSTRNTQALGLCQSLCPGRQARCLPGTVQVCREPAEIPQEESQTCGKTTQTHPLRIFPHLEPSSVTGESVGGPESP